LSTPTTATSTPNEALVATTPDGQLSTTWLDQAGDFAQTGGAAVAQNTGTNLAVLDTTTAFVHVSATVSGIGTIGNNAGVVAHYSGTGDNTEYVAQVVNITGKVFQLQILKKVNGVQSTLKVLTLTTAQFNGTGGIALSIQAGGVLQATAGSATLTV